MTRLDIERADFMRTPGRRGDLTFGPFTFTAVTADEGFLAFWVRLGRWGFGWEIQVWP